MHQRCEILNKKYYINSIFEHTLPKLLSGFRVRKWFAVGLVTKTSDFFVFVIMQSFISNIAIVNLTAAIISGCTNFALHFSITWRHRKLKTSRTMQKYIIVNVFIYAIETTLIYLFRFLGVSLITSKFIIMFFLSFVVLVVSNRFIFFDSQDYENLKIIEDQDNNLLAILVRGTYKVKGVNFVTPLWTSMQIGIMNRGPNSPVRRHKHNLVKREIKGTSEFIIVRSGKARVKIFNNYGEFVYSASMYRNDSIYFVSGGHSVDFPTTCEILEVKQGPYNELNDKEYY